MKRRIFTLLILALLCFPASAGTLRSRKLTLMIYMCGSNLESVYGSATADIQEMLAARVDPRDVSVLVMAGGADVSQQGGYFQTDSTGIFEIASGRIRRVWSSDAPLNMGDGKTLETLLEYGWRSRPADSYALILWDHGGGPLGGVCWDELYSQDQLTLRELTGALNRMKSYTGRLSWIGFDACLMASAEVAVALSPYAAYMIASQETEPASGWSYAFLSGLGADEDGAATGRRVIDGYFESLAGSRDVLTMACVDLTRISEATDELDAFFDPLSQTLTAGDFARISGLRMSVVGFGKGLRAANVNDYDLVDLMDLISRYGDEDAPALKALRDAVVYSRSTEEGASGLSVYHPYTNKEKYRTAWRRAYDDLRFSNGYARYVSRFGALLTGESAVRWDRLQTRDLGFDEDGVHRFSLDLTPAQQAEVVSARLMILQSPNGFLGIHGSSLYPVAVETAELGADGVLTAAYRGRTLSIVDDQGRILQDPVSFLLTDDGQYMAAIAHYYDYSGRPDAKPETFVLYHLRADRGPGDWSWDHRYVYDRTIEGYTNRIAFSEDGFTDMNFWLHLRNVPDTDGQMKGYADWDRFNGYMEHRIDAGVPWRFRISEGRQATGLYASFQITDSRQNTWSSIPILIENPSEQVFSLTPDTLEADGISLRLSASLNPDDVPPLVRLVAECTNRTDSALSVAVEPVVLNGSRTLGESLTFYSIPAGGSQLQSLTIGAEALTGLSTITRLDATVRYGENLYDEEQRRSVPLSCAVGNGSVAVLYRPMPEPLAETADGGLTWRLLSLRQADDGSISGLLACDNGTDELIEDHSLSLWLNGIDMHTGFSVTAAPHTTRLIPFQASNRVTLSRYSLTVASGTGNLYLMALDRLLERSGETRLSTVSLYPRQGDPAVLSLADPLPLPAPAEPYPAPVPLLTGPVTAALEGVYVADNGVAFVLSARNGLAEAAALYCTAPEINGEALAFDTYGSPVISLPAQTAAHQIITLKCDTAGLREARLTFRFRNTESEPVVIRFPESGVTGGTYLPAARLGITPAPWSDAPMLIAEAAVLTDCAASPVTLTAPLAGDEADNVEWINATIGFYGQEVRPDGETESVHRTIVQQSLTRDGDGRYRAVFSGLALTANGIVLPANETALEDGGFRLSFNDLYGYKDAGTYQPTGKGLFWDGGYDVTAGFSVTAAAEGGRWTIADADHSMSFWNDPTDGRTNLPRSAMAVAAGERRVYFGTDRPANVNTADYSEPFLFPDGESVTPELVPIGALEGPFCVYYAIQLTDGTRADRVVSWTPAP